MAHQQLHAAMATTRLEHLCALNIDSEPSTCRMTGIVCTIGRLFYTGNILHAKSNFTSFHRNLFAIWKYFYYFFVVYYQNSEFSLSITGFISLVQEKISSLLMIKNQNWKT